MLKSKLYAKRNGVVVYIDDIAVYGESIEEHAAVLRWVFEMLADADLFLRTDKCEFEKPSISLLGFHIGGG